ncbi:MAG: hypothetical protein IPH77_16520 [Ignavibacteria bacterium]|nr:hypothetical protein [Ignavibacteria bacterium]
MKNIYGLLLLSIFTVNVSFSQWQWQNPLPQGNILFGSYFLNSNTGYACGDGGTIIKTTDGGLNWNILLSQTKESVRSLHFINSLTGFACGLNKLLIKTIDAGQSWQPVSVNASANLFAVKFLNNTTGFVCGDNGELFRTADGGTVWTLIQTNTSRTLTSLAVSDSVVLTAGLYGRLQGLQTTAKHFRPLIPAIQIIFSMYHLKIH